MRNEERVHEQPSTHASVHADETRRRASGAACKRRGAAHFSAAASSESASAVLPSSVSRLNCTRSAAMPWPPRRSPRVIAPSVSRRRATDDAKRCSPPTSVVRIM